MLNTDARCPVEKKLLVELIPKCCGLFVYQLTVLSTIAHTLMMLCCALSVCVCTHVFANLWVQVKVGLVFCQFCAHFCCFVFLFCGVYEGGGGGGGVCKQTAVTRMDFVNQLHKRLWLDAN